MIVKKSVTINLFEILALECVGSIVSFRFLAQPHNMTNCRNTRFVHPNSAHLNPRLILLNLFGLVDISDDHQLVWKNLVFVNFEHLSIWAKILNLLSHLSVVKTLTKKSTQKYYNFVYTKLKTRKPNTPWNIVNQIISSFCFVFASKCKANRPKTGLTNTKKKHNKNNRIRVIVYKRLYEYTENVIIALIIIIIIIFWHMNERQQKIYYHCFALVIIS